MNVELKNKIKEYNIIINKTCRELGIEFEKDLLFISLAQFLLNVFSFDNIIVEDEILKVNYYTNFQILKDDIKKIEKKICESNKTIPFIFQYLNYLNEVGLELLRNDMYELIILQFSYIAIDSLGETINTDQEQTKCLYEYISKIYDNKIKRKEKNINIEKEANKLFDFVNKVNDIILNDWKNINVDKCSNNSESLEDTLKEFNNYIGLKKVKEEINNLVKLIQVRKIREQKGLKNPDMTYHLCFLGNPGTGKTSIARIVAKLYKTLGILKTGQLIEVGRQDLVGGYVGQTAIKTKEVIEKAYGGVLFIDEAYSLTNKGSENDFGVEAVEVILKEMEDHRDELVVIVAGYDDLMHDFLSSNPGLESRFNTFINFEDYSPNELVDIINIQCKKNDYIMDENCKKELRIYMEKVYANKPKDFANARYARNMFENAIKKQSMRIAEYEENVDIEVLKKLEIEDFNK